MRRWWSGLSWRFCSQWKPSAPLATSTSRSPRPLNRRPGCVVVNQGRALMGYTGEITAMAKTPDGRLVTGSSDGTVWVWDVDRRDGTALALNGQDEPVNALAVSA